MPTGNSTSIFSINRVIVAFVVSIIAMTGHRSAASQSDSISITGEQGVVSLQTLHQYLPVFHGTLRPRFEWDTHNDVTRFQVKNARFSAGGNVGERVEYFMQVDFCSEGSFKMLDFWGKIKIINGVNVQAGQFRMPFGVDPFRAPHTYIFANRSFIGKYVCNIRAVGVKGIFNPDNIPLALEGGIFNPASTASQTQWSSKIAASAKAVFSVNQVQLSLGGMTITPAGFRANLMDVAVTWNFSQWTLEAEYMNKHYVHDAHKSCHAYNFFVDYRMPVKWLWFNQWSLQGRVDGMSAHSSLIPNSEGRLITNQSSRNRITVGSTIGWIKSKNLFVEFKVDYEKYLYPKGVEIAYGEGDKLLAEMVVRF